MEYCRILVIAWKDIRRYEGVRGLGSTNYRFGQMNAQEQVGRRVACLERAATPMDLEAWKDDSTG